MTLADLISFASYGAAMDKYATNEQYADIREFAKTCGDLLPEDLEDLKLSRLDHDDITNTIQREIERQKEGFLS